jgi:Cu/Ag efflux pump CusA
LLFSGGKCKLQKSKMLSNIVRWVIDRRWLVVLATVIVSLWTFYVIPQMPLDVLPPFAPPQVEIQTEAPGLVPEISAVRVI